MTLTVKTFPEIITYSRGTGATRVNAAGLIVGVDFSATSNTIGTGSKSFTLTADASVNRDWAVGSSVRAVDQVGGGTMIGTVTSYTPSTQVLVINVTSITGSGTSTNWRIGTLEFRIDYDPVTLAVRGGLVESGATNLFLNSESPVTGSSSNGMTVTANAAVSPDGSITADRIIATAGTIGAGHFYVRNLGVNLGASVTTRVFAKQDTLRYLTLGSGNSDFNGWPRATFDLQTGTFAQTKTGDAGGNFISGRMIPVGGGYYFCETVTAPAGGNTNAYFGVAGGLNNGQSYSGDGTSGLLVFGMQVFQGQNVADSYIPTTTVQVTKATDLANVDGARFSQFYKAGGTFVAEIIPTAIASVAASFNDGTVNNYIRLQRSAGGLAETPVNTAGVLQANPVLAALTANATNKIAIRIKENDFAVSVNGAAVVTDTSVILPVLSQLSLGMNGVSGSQFNGWLRKFNFYTDAYSDAQLVSAST